MCKNTHFSYYIIDMRDTQRVYRQIWVKTSIYLYLEFLRFLLCKEGTKIAPTQPGRGGTAYADLLFLICAKDNRDAKANNRDQHHNDQRHSREIVAGLRDGRCSPGRCRGGSRRRGGRGRGCGGRRRGRGCGVLRRGVVGARRCRRRGRHNGRRCRGRRGIGVRLGVNRVRRGFFP